MEQSWLSERKFHHNLVVAAILGISIGVFATGFRIVWLDLKDVLWATFDATYWRAPVSIGAGILIGTILSTTFYPGAISVLVEQLHNSGEVELKDNIPLVPVGLIGLVSGQNAGPEGVMSGVGGSFGTYISQLFDFDNSVKLFTLAGMGAGFGTILGAPIGGALLWLELPHDRGVEYYEAIVPTLVASFAGYLTELTLGGMYLFPVWEASAVDLTHLNLMWAIVVGSLCIPFGFVYTKTFDLIGVFYDKLSLPIFFQTTLAGGVIGGLGVVVPLSYFYGGFKMNTLISGDFPLMYLVVTLGAVMVAASFTIQGKWIGGLIIPHMFMGALVGRAAALIIPDLPPMLAMLAGMAAFNSVVTGTPLSSALIAIALTNGASVTMVFLSSFAAFVGSPFVRFIKGERRRSEPPDFHIPGDD